MAPVQECSTLEALRERAPPACALHKLVWYTNGTAALPRSPLTLTGLSHCLAQDQTGTKPRGLHQAGVATAVRVLVLVAGVAMRPSAPSPRAAARGVGGIGVGGAELVGSESASKERPLSRPGMLAMADGIVDFRRSFMSSAVCARSIRCRKSWLGSSSKRRNFRRPEVMRQQQQQRMRSEGRLDDAFGWRGTRSAGASPLVDDVAMPPSD